MENKITGSDDEYVGIHNQAAQRHIFVFIDYPSDNIGTSRTAIMNEYKTDSKVIIPILANGDPIGSVTILPAAGKSLSDLEFTTARLGAGFLGRQMDN